MIKKEELCTVYKDGYFFEGGDKIVITENNLTNPDSDLKKFTISGLNGRYIQISADWLKDTCQPYQTMWKKMSLLRRDCDSVFLFTHNGEEYIVWLELKSGFDSATSKAMFQLVGSCIRSKSYLTVFPSYSEHGRHEFFVIISHPDTTSDEEMTRLVKKSKTMYTPDIPSVSDRLAAKYRRKLKAGHGMTILNAEDFMLDDIPISDNCKFRTMPLLHLTAEGQEATIGISDLLERIFNGEDSKGV